jgi:hypothetical protein
VRRRALIRPQWHKLWIISLLLTALFGFAYGWSQREENPPHSITREKEPPEYRLLKKGRYDEAAKTILESIKDERKDYRRYQDVATVYYARAAKDPANREKWIDQASSYAGPRGDHELLVPQDNDRIDRHGPTRRDVARDDGYNQ